MDTSALIGDIDDEIARLRQAKALLAGDGAARGARAGRPAGFHATGPRKKRRLSAEARAKIAAAQRKRWAKQKAASK